MVAIDNNRGGKGPSILLADDRVESLKSHCKDSSIQCSCEKGVVIIDFSDSADLTKLTVDKAIALAAKISTCAQLTLSDRIVWISEPGQPVEHADRWTGSQCVVKDHHFEFLSKYSPLKTLHLVNCTHLALADFKHFSKFQNLTALHCTGFTLHPKLLSNPAGEFSLEKVAALGAAINTCPKLTQLMLEFEHPGQPPTAEVYSNTYIDLNPVTLLEQLNLKLSLREMSLTYKTDTLPKLRVASMRAFARSQPALKEFVYGEMVQKAGTPLRQKEFNTQELVALRATNQEHQAALRGIERIKQRMVEQALNAFPKEKLGSQTAVTPHRKIELYDQEDTPAMRATKKAHLEELEKLIQNEVTSPAHRSLIWTRATELLIERGIADDPNDPNPGKTHFLAPNGFATKAQKGGHGGKIDFILDPIAEEIGAMIIAGSKSGQASKQEHKE